MVTIRGGGELLLEAQFDALCRRAREANLLLYRQLDDARQQMTVRP